MKSNPDELTRRGYIRENDLSAMLEIPITAVQEYLRSPDASVRSAAVRVLSQAGLCDTAVLLEILKNEKALYTRLEICRTLESGGPDDAEIMCGYLAKIGKNQYKTVPDKISRKNSYPLPRDIIARALGKMHPRVFPVIAGYREKANRTALRELIDAMGYMVFYNPELVSEESFGYIARICDKNMDDPLIIWKIAVCCRAFPIKESILLLEEIIRNSENNTIISDARKSLIFLIEKSNYT